MDFFHNYGKGFRPPSAITELGLDPNLESAENETIEMGVQYNSADGVWHLLGDPVGDAALGRTEAAQHDEQSLDQNLFARRCPPLLHERKVAWGEYFLA